MVSTCTVDQFNNNSPLTFYVDQAFPFSIPLQHTYQYDFNQMRARFGELIHAVAPLIEAVIPSLNELKTYLRGCFPELRPQLSTVETFDDIMDLVQKKCTIINVCCLETIVNYYKITKAIPHIKEFKTKVDEFCKKVKIDICLKQNFNVASSSYHIICESIEFILQWKPDEYTLSDVEDLLSKAFEDMAKSVQVRAINEGNSIIITCYAPQYMMDILLMTAEKNLDQLKQLALLNLSFGYVTIYNKNKRDEVRDE